MPGPTARTSPVRPDAPLAAALLLTILAVLSTDAPAAIGSRAGLAGVTGGVKVGASFSQHQGVDDPALEYTVASSWRRGLSAADFLHLPITDRFGLQQEIVYVRKGSRQVIGVEVFEDVAPVDMDVVYDLDYLEVPVLMRYVWWRGGRRGRPIDLYGLSGFAFALKIDDRYRLDGLLVGEPDEDPVPLSADAPMDEVDIFDFAFVYGLGLELPVRGARLLIEYRFSLSLDRLELPTYAYVPFGDEQVRVDNDPVPLRNQAHALMLGIRF
jgi:hypothetical protein